MNRRTSGFTLVEMMVVMAVLGVLVQLATIKYVAFQAKTRDTIRRDTLKRLQTALENYYVDHEVYPDPAAIGGPGAVSTASQPGGQAGGTYYGPEWIPGLSPRYIDSCPIDPIGGLERTLDGCYAAGALREYFYISYDGGKNYKLVSHCSSETGAYDPGDMFYDPQRPTWSWSVTNNSAVTATW